MENVLVLAYLGDSVYEVYIRKYLIDKKISKVNNLQKEAIKYVSAKGQCNLINNLINNNFLTEEELNVFYRARNHKTNSHPKNTDIITYKYAFLPLLLVFVVAYFLLALKNRTLHNF